MTGQHIFLIGPMGAGKSTIGREIAGALDRTFFDIDSEVIKSSGADIQWIFDVEGEEGFRERESRALRQAIKAPAGAIIATGGGIVLRKENRVAMVGAGQVVYLSATKQQLYERIKRDKVRPLLQVGDRKAVIDKLFDERDPLYREVASLTFSSDETKASKVAAELIRALASD
jgi:shikimate kinase